MYFTVNLAFVDYLEQLNETLDTPIERNWTNYRQILPISLESFQLNSILLQAPITLQDFVNQYQANRKIVKTQKTQSSNFKSLMDSFITDVLVFIAALVTVVITFIIIDMLTGQPKLKH